MDADLVDQVIGTAQRVVASGMGGPVEIPADLRAAALQRVMAFDSRGTVHA